MKGWSRRVSCVDRRVSCVGRRVSCVDSGMGILSGQTPRPDDEGGRGLVMWVGLNQDGIHGWTQVRSHQFI